MQENIEKPDIKMTKPIEENNYFVENDEGDGDQIQERNLEGESRQSYNADAEEPDMVVQ